MALAVGPVAAINARLGPDARVIGTVRACEPDAGVLERMKVLATTGCHHVARAEAIQGNQYSMKLTPAR